MSKYNDRLKYVTNFSGSFGFFILQKKISLFVDGRYTLQATKANAESIFKIKTIPNELPKDILKKKKLKIGYDPRFIY